MDILLDMEKEKDVSLSMLINSISIRIKKSFHIMAKE